MSNILDEIREDIEQEKWLKLWKKYQKYLSTALILILAGISLFLFLQRRNENILHSQSNNYIQAMYLMDSGQTEKALQRLERIPMEGETIYASLSRLWVAAFLTQKGDEQGAETIYKKVLSETKGFLGIGANEPLYNFALIKWAYLTLDNGNEKEILNKIKPLTKNTNPWRFSAWEISGLIQEKLGNADEALAYYEKILSDPKAPSSFKIKAQALSNLLKSKDAS